MRTSWRRQPPKGNTLTSWEKAYSCYSTGVSGEEFKVDCLYEDVSPGFGSTPEAAKADFCENIRLKVAELTEMLEYCALNTPRKTNCE